MIKGKGICKSFGEKEVISNLNFDICRGRVYALIGGNGCGKSTLMKIIKGVYSIDSGKISCDMEEMFYLGEENYIFNGYTVKRFATYLSKFYPKFSWEKFRILLDELGFNGDEMCTRLSKGEKKQVLICMGLSTCTQVVLLDEPFSGIDFMKKTKLKKLLLKEVAERELTVVISSHDFIDLEEMCDTVGIIESGKLILEEEILRLRTQMIKVRYIGEKMSWKEQGENRIELIKRKSGDRFTEDIIKGDKWIIEKEFSKSRCDFFQINNMSLREVYIDLVGRIRDGK